MKKIVVIGPESTGKSILCEQLAKHYKTLWCPEYAREYLLVHGKQYTYENLLTIARGQVALEDKYIDKVNGQWSMVNIKDTSNSPLTIDHSPLLFIDTDMYVMKVWCEFVFGKCHQYILNQIAERKYDLYLLCNTDLPWVKDELREYPDLETREKLFQIYKDIMINQAVPWVEISGTNEGRLQKAITAVDKLLSARTLWRKNNYHYFRCYMKEFLQKNHRLVFYGTWLLLGLMQAGLTELQDDEAYYWVFSKYLSLGYFDHPPMIAVLVKMGYAIFPNELGVRIFPLLLNVFSLVIIEKLIDKKNPLLFYAIALSIAILQLTGFAAVPDIPLIFFTALFFLFYKKFADKQSGLNTLLLGISIALLFYTKYHAVLIVLFTMFSNIRLLAKYKTYIAGFIALILFLPHLAWQFEHNWISFRYHLFESNVNAYKVSFTAEYLFGQLILPGPIAGFILLPAAFLYKTRNAAEKAMWYSMIGIYVFFLLSSFRGKVEANWTSPVIVSLMVLSHQYLLEKFKWQQLLFRLLPVTLFIVLFARIIMIVDILPVKQIKQRYHAWKEWPAIMKEKTKGLPIVFSNSYQRTSKYWFYSGQMTLSQNLYKERRNNYNFWPIEKEMLGKPVYFLDIFDLKRFPDSLKTPIGYVGYRYDSSFLSFETVNIPFYAKHMIQEGDSIRFHYGSIPMIGSKQWLYLSEHPQSRYSVNLVFFRGKKIIKEIPVSLDILRINQKTCECTFTLKPDLPRGHYQIMLSFAVPGYNPTHNSEKIKLVIE